MRVVLSVLLAVFFLCNMPTHSLAADAYPSKPIKMIVPWSAGGATDQLCRIFEQALTKILGQSIAFIYKPGAAGTVGHGEVARAKPDGYTITVNLYPLEMIRTRLGIGTLKEDDLLPLCLVGTDSVAVVVANNSPFKTLDDMVKAAKAKPGSVSMGSAERFGTVHATAQAFVKAGIPVNVVPFAGGATQMNQALLGNQLDISTQNYGIATSILSKARVLALASEKRSDIFPGIPTLKELGYDIAFTNLRGFSVPKGTPQAIVEKLNAAFKQACESPEVIERMRSMGITTVYYDHKATLAALKEMEKTAAYMVEDLFKDEMKK